MTTKWLYRVSLCVVGLSASSLPAFGAPSPYSNAWGVKAHYATSEIAQNFSGSMRKAVFPKQTYTFGAAVEFAPRNWSWHGPSAYFQAGADFWHSNFSGTNKNLGIFYFAPVIRFSFFEDAVITPFLEASAGPAMMTHTRFANRNLSIHYTFRDMLGVGASFCHLKRCAIGIHVLHNSNANFSKPNRGMSIWPSFSFAYRFY
ncbi:MAG: hypothetical protein COB66_04310 [Coxiella sp. (in: Bacteria)]|nr:MAG: hypothetical protein COB66_04310 [Coxiella sp. (in: g-proteobacteria)]